MTAGLVAALTACGAQPEPVTTGRFTAQIESAVPETQRLPSLAGQLHTINTDSLIVQSLQQTQTLSLNRQTTWQGTNGQISSINQRLQFSQTQTYPQTVLIWHTDGIATHIQELPPISATNDLPTLSPSNTGTGENVSLGPLTFISRQGWGAQPRQSVSGGESGEYDAQFNPNGWLVYDEPLKDQIHTAVVHHSALEFWHGPQMIQALHMTTAKFADIGYHFVIDGFGQLYEGRPLDTRGAHTGGFNTGYVGICLMGNFEIAPPIQAQLNTLYQLLAYLRQTYSLIQLGGHRDFQPGVTVCPGRNFHPQLPTLASQLGYTYYQS